MTRWALVLAVTACASPIPATGPCSVDARRDIGARFVAAVEKACDRSKPLSACEAYPGIRLGYELERKAFVSCEAP